MCSFCLSKEPFLRTKVPPGSLQDMTGSQQCQPCTGSWERDIHSGTVGNQSLQESSIHPGPRPQTTLLISHLATTAASRAPRASIVAALLRGGTRLQWSPLDPADSQETVVLVAKALPYKG